MDKLDIIIRAAQSLLEDKDRDKGLDKRVIIAIDGRCAAGKTTLAAALEERCGWNVFHMDDFFLRPFQRTKERLETPGGNVDYERFLEEVLIPLRSGKEGEGLSYAPYDCHTDSLMPPVEVFPETVNVVEGAYSCHPALWDYYDLRVFLQVDKAEQTRRIAQRNGDNAEMFFKKWIPLEEEYFAAYRIEQRCDLRLKS